MIEKEVIKSILIGAANDFMGDDSFELPEELMDTIKNTIENVVGKKDIPMEEIKAVFSSGSPPMVLLRVIDMAIDLARSEVTLVELNFLDEMRSHLEKTGHKELAESLQMSSVRIIRDGDGGHIHSQVLAQGDNVTESNGRIYPSGNPAEDDPEAARLLWEAAKAGVEAHVNVWDEADYAEAMRLIMKVQPEMDVDKSFKGTVTRVAERTEEEVASFRSEIDDLFETWEGGST